MVAQVRPILLKHVWVAPSKQLDELVSGELLQSASKLMVMQRQPPCSNCHCHEEVQRVNLLHTMWHFSWDAMHSLMPILQSSSLMAATALSVSQLMPCLAWSKRSYARSALRKAASHLPLHLLRPGPKGPQLQVWNNLAMSCWGRRLSKPFCITAMNGKGHLPVSTMAPPRHSAPAHSGRMKLPANPCCDPLFKTSPMSLRTGRQGRTLPHESSKKRSR